MNDRRPALGRAVLALVLAALLPTAAAGEGPEEPDDWLPVARAALGSIVRIEWRPRSGRGAPVERHAVIVDPEGWLLMAGPPTGPGTLAATLDDGRAMGARVHASDADTGLTLLRIPPVGRLPALGIHATRARHADGSPREVPHRIAPGTPVALVNAEGAVSLGQIRANHRTRQIQDPQRGAPRPVTCLDEAPLSVVVSDLGAPWLDAQGRIAGLLVGADMTRPTPARAADGRGMVLRPRIVTAYAVPASVLEVVWPLLRDRAEVPRALLGVRTRDLDEALAAHVCPGCGGRVVTAVAEDGPAARAGVREGDILRGLGGAPLAPDGALADALLPYRPEEPLLLSLIRGGERMDLVVHLGRAP